MSAPTLEQARALLREAQARISVALDSTSARTPEMEALAQFYDGPLGAHCWCRKPHKGACEDESEVIADCDDMHAQAAYDRAHP